ncbi:MAG: T9SS type A sorting domain-containing protein [Bacteroidota bacterium]
MTTVDPSKVYRLLLTSLLLLTCAGPLYAQAPKPRHAPFAHASAPDDCEVGRAEAELAVSDVRARLYNMGGLFWRARLPVYQIPKGGSLSPLFSFNFWITGFVGEELRAAGSLYGPFEFAPGPLDDTGNAPTDCAAFDRIWTVTDQDLRRYDTTGEATDDLRDWPAALGAEVIDGDGNPNNYDLAAGDRPRLFGTQTAFWVMNDVGVPHLNTSSDPLGVEVQVTAWAVASREAALDQATYYRYRFVNRTTVPIDDLIVTYFIDPDLGNEFEDDYIGSDPARSLAFVYNADNEDKGHPDRGYGTPPPSFGLRLLDPLAGSATYFNSGSCDDLCEPGPDNVEEWRHYQVGRWLDGRPLTVGSTGRTGTEPTSFVYSGEPGTYWSEVCPNEPDCSDPIPPSDRRFQISTVAFDLPAGSSRDVTFALPFAFGTQNYGPVGNPTGSVQAMKLASDRIQAAFDDGSLFAPAPRPLTLDAPTLLEPADGAVVNIVDGEPPPTLRWSPVAGAEGYRLLFEVERDGQTFFRSAYSADTEHTLSFSPPDNTTYVYRWLVEADGRLADGTRTAGSRSDQGLFTLYRYVPGLLGDNGQGIVEVASASGDDPCATTPDDEGCADGFGGNTVWQDPDASRDYYVSTSGFRGALSWIQSFGDIVQEDEVELRFTAACAEPGACLAAYVSSRDGEILSVPFEAWYLADTPDDPSDDLRMIPYVSETGEGPITDFADTFTGTDPWDQGTGAPITERIYLYMPDRPDGYARFNEAARTFGGPGAVYDRDADGDAQTDVGQDGEECRLQGMYTNYCFRGPGNSPNYLYRNLVLADAAGDGTTPDVGTVIRFVTHKRKPVADEAETPQPEVLTLDTYPNPVRGTATLAYTLPEASRATLAVYDVLGRRVAVVTDETKAAGIHTAQLDTARLASGVYVAVLATEAGQQTRRFTVLR